jgi:hypothetical protein
MKKGIYCLEGQWNQNNIQDKSSVLPILELMERTGYCNYIYHNCATIEELEYYLEKWKNKKICSKFPILYLAFHGQMGHIFITKKKKYSLDEIGDFLAGKCYGKVIYFGSCSTFDLNKRNIKNFLEKTDAIAAIGYKNDIDWIQSTACDLFVFEALQFDKLDSKGIRKIYKTIRTDYGNLHSKLGLTVVINDMKHFPRKREKIKNHIQHESN